MITGQGAIWSQTSQAANLVRPSPSACLIDIWPAFCSDTQSWAQDAITMSCHSRLLLRLRTKLEATAPHPKRQRSTSQSQSHSQHQLSPSPQIKPFVHASQLLLMIPVAIHWLLTGCGAQSSLDSLQSFHHAHASSLAHPPHLTSSLMLGRQLVLLDLVLVRTSHLNPLPKLKQWCRTNYMCFHGSCPTAVLTLTTLPSPARLKLQHRQPSFSRALVADPHKLSVTCRLRILRVINY